MRNIQNDIIREKIRYKPVLKTILIKTINQYITDIFANKICINKRNDNFKSKVNYIPRNDAGKKCENALLNEYLLKRPGLLKNLVGVLLDFSNASFRGEKFHALLTADINQSTRTFV